MLDLRAFLAENAADVMRLAEPISVRYEVTALQHELWRRGEFPVIWVENPITESHSAFRIPHSAITNLTASREVTARAFGLSNHRAAAFELGERIAKRIEPFIISPENAPCKEVILRGTDATLAHLPVFTQHEGDAGPYLTAAHATTYDPETGVDNTAIQRVWVKSPQRFGYFPYPASHNRANIMKFWERGLPAPVAFWLGHHPAVSVGAQASLGYPESHWGAAGALAGQAARLVGTELFGDKIRVPAEAEIVLEGYVPPNVLEPEGPFGEYTGYQGAATVSPVFELHCVTQRRDALYHDYGSGLPDALVPDNMMIEARLFALARAVSDAVLNVHVPLSGRRFHAYLQCREVAPGEAREILRAVLQYRRTKLAVLVNEDIDIFDDAQVLWAVATRTQMNRDALILQDLPGTMLDPSLPPGVGLTAKTGINATWKTKERPPVNRAATRS
jgi:UbiD family decarboxylase